MKLLTSNYPNPADLLIYRKKLMSDLLIAFDPQQEGHRFVILHGKSGIGKTALASLFFNLPGISATYRYAGWYHVEANFLANFVAQTTDDLSPGIWTAVLDMHDRPNPEKYLDCAQRIRNFLNSDEASGRKLLIFDGIRDFSKIEPHLHLLQIQDANILFCCTDTLPQQTEKFGNTFRYKIIEMEPFSSWELEEWLEKLDFDINAQTPFGLFERLRQHPLVTDILIKTLLTEGLSHTIAYMEALHAADRHDPDGQHLLAALFQKSDLSTAMKWVMLQFAAMPEKGLDASFAARLLGLTSAKSSIYRNGFNIFKGYKDFTLETDPTIIFSEILESLIQKGWLLENEGGEYRLHRSIIPLLQRLCPVKFDYFLELAQNLKPKLFFEEYGFDATENPDERLQLVANIDYESYLDSFFEFVTETTTSEYLDFLKQYADVLNTQFVWEKEIEVRTRILDITRAIYPDNSRELLQSLNNLGLLYNDAGQASKGLELLLEALEIGKQVFSELDNELATVYNNVGSSCDKLGNHITALEYKQKALEIRKQILPELHPVMATSYNNIGSSYGAIGDHKTAMEYEQKALEINKQILSPLHPVMATSYNNIGSSYGALGDHKTALEYKQKALEIRKQILPELHPDIALSYNNIGSSYGALGDHKTALEYKQKALEIYKQILPELHPDMAISFNNVGATHGVLGNYKMALEYLQKALEIGNQVLPDSHPDLALIHQNIAKTLEQLKQNDDAE